VRSATMDPDIRDLLLRLMDDEVSPFLACPAGIDLAAYKAELISRFSNPAIGDSLERIAADAGNRIGKFLGPALADALAADAEIRALAFVTACWIRTLAGADDMGAPLPFNDPPSEDLRAPAREICGARAVGRPEIQPFLRIFPALVLGSTRFADEVAAYLSQINATGTRAALRAMLGGEDRR
jgi:mannitol 2-dehydrogenase